MSLVSNEARQAQRGCDVCVSGFTIVTALRSLTHCNGPIVLMFVLSISCTGVALVLHLVSSFWHLSGDSGLVPFTLSLLVLSLLLFKPAKASNGNSRLSASACLLRLSELPAYAYEAVFLTLSR